LLSDRSKASAEFGPLAVQVGEPHRNHVIDYSRRTWPDDDQFKCLMHLYSPGSTVGLKKPKRDRFRGQTTCLNLNILVYQSRPLKLVLCSGSVSARVGKTLSQRALVPRCGPKEVGQRISDRVRDPCLSLAVEEEITVRDLSLPLEAQQHRMPEVRFEAAAQSSACGFVLVLLDSDQPPELLPDRPNVRVYL
jgi:hypothetical protein